MDSSHEYPSQTHEKKTQSSICNLSLLIGNGVGVGDIIDLVAAKWGWSRGDHQVLSMLIGNGAGVREWLKSRKTSGQWVWSESGKRAVVPQHRSGAIGIGEDGSGANIPQYWLGAVGIGEEGMVRETRGEPRELACGDGRRCRSVRRWATMEIRSDQCGEGEVFSLSNFRFPGQRARGRGTKLEFINCRWATREEIKTFAQRAAATALSP
ncbi:hypothetical protein ACLOJK_018156 [Asimina triloba]